MKKKFLLLIAVLTIVATAFVVTGCGEDEEAGDWEYIEKNGKIIVGLDATFAPMGFTDKDDNIVGFDVDLAKAVGEKLGVEMEFKSIDWDAKYTELDAKNIDCIWNGMSATPERAEKLSLSKEYFNNKIVVMTLKDEVKVAKSEDLANYNVGIQADSSALEVVKEDKAYDKFKDKIKEYKSYDDAITDMQAGRMDCVVIDEVLGNYKNTKMKNALKDERRELDFNWDKKYSVYYTDMVRQDLNMTLSELMSLYEIAGRRYEVLRMKLVPPERVSPPLTR